MSVSVLIPTFRRNEALKRAVKSVFEQSVRPDEIIIVDNSPEAGAKAMIDALKTDAPVPLVYVHEASPGVANARNKGFGKASFDRIAQLDDDESASKDWLKHLVEIADTHQAGLVFGPVVSAPTARAGALKSQWLSRLYSRLPEIEDGPTSKAFGCGNSLIDRGIAKLPAPVFDARTNETGGEDDLLFAYLCEHNTPIAWAGKAVVTEHVEDQRVNWRSILHRSFAYGQGPTQLAFEARNYPLVGVWMSVGFIQALIYGLGALPARVMSSRLCAYMLDRAVQGVGKLVWAGQLSPRLYGVAKLDHQPRQA